MLSLSFSSSTKTLFRPSSRYISQLKSAPIKDVNGEYRSINYYDSKYDNRLKQDSTKPVLVLLCGTAQTITSWSSHIRALAAQYRLIIPELRCQGRLTNLDYQYASIPQHIQDVKQFLSVTEIPQAHIAGFSFGGRVGLALAAHAPELVQSLSLSGVPLRRPPVGQLIMESWLESLKNRNMRACALSFLLNGYSEQFLTKYHHRVESFVASVAAANDPLALEELVRQNIRQDHCAGLPSNCAPGPLSAASLPGCTLSRYQDPYLLDYSAEVCATIVSCPVQVIAGSHDRIAGFNAEQELAKSFPNGGAEFGVITECGHLTPFEKPQEWRRLLVAFLRDVSHRFSDN